MKILHVIFSTNRIKYLTRSLESHKFLDYGDHKVTKLVIDDWPATRNNSIFELLCKTHGMMHWLHAENIGLSPTWTQFFDWVKDQDYDYILHQEDDVVLLEPVKIDDLISIMDSDEKAASVILSRQPWYFIDKEHVVKPDDWVWNGGQYYCEKTTGIFSIIFSLYRKKLTELPIKEHWGFNLNEGMVGVYVSKQLDMYSYIIKNSKGSNIIEHIGEISIGKRVLETEPGFENFNHIKLDKFYSSRTGVELDNLSNNS